MLFFYAKRHGCIGSMWVWCITSSTAPLFRASCSCAFLFDFECNPPHLKPRSTHTSFHIVASELMDPIWHSSEWQIGSFSSEATICFIKLSIWFNKRWFHFLRSELVPLRFLHLLSLTVNWWRTREVNLHVFLPIIISALQSQKNVTVYLKSKQSLHSRHVMATLKFTYLGRKCKRPCAKLTIYFLLDIGLCTVTSSGSSPSDLSLLYLAGRHNKLWAVCRMHLSIFTHMWSNPLAILPMFLEHSRQTLCSFI